MNLALRRSPVFRKRVAKFVRYPLKQKECYPRHHCALTPPHDHAGCAHPPEHLRGRPRPLDQQAPGHLHAGGRGECRRRLGAPPDCGRGVAILRKVLRARGARRARFPAARPRHLHAPPARAPARAHAVPSRESPQPGADGVGRVPPPPK